MQFFREKKPNQSSEKSTEALKQEINSLKKTIKKIKELDEEANSVRNEIKEGIKLFNTIIAKDKQEPTFDIKNDDDIQRFFEFINVNLPSKIKEKPYAYKHTTTLAKNLSQQIRSLAALKEQQEKQPTPKEQLEERLKSLEASLGNLTHVKNKEEHKSDVIPEYLPNPPKTKKK